MGSGDKMGLLLDRLLRGFDPVVKPGNALFRGIERLPGCRQALLQALQAGSDENVCTLPPATSSRKPRWGSVME